MVLSWEEAKVGLDFAGSGALAFQMSPGHEGEAWEGFQLAASSKGHRLSDTTSLEGRV